MKTWALAFHAEKREQIWRLAIGNIGLHRPILADHAPDDPVWQSCGEEHLVPPLQHTRRAGSHVALHNEDALP